MQNHSIKGQLLASTGPTLNGFPIPEEAIQTLFEQTPAETYLYRHHDPSLPPIGRLYNKQLERRADGTLAILADVDFKDGEDLSSYGGFSISFLGPLGYRSEKRQAATICLDVRYFDNADIESVAGDISDELGIGSRELYRYSVGAATATVVIIVVGFPSLEFAKGFFSQAGKDFFTFVKGKLAALTAKQQKAGRAVEFDFAFEVTEGGQTYEVHVKSDMDTLKIVETGLVSIDDLKTEVSAIHDPYKVERVLARLHSHPPYLRTEHVVPRISVTDP